MVSESLAQAIEKVTERQKAEAVLSTIKVTCEALPPSTNNWPIPQIEEFIELLQWADSFGYFEGNGIQDMINNLSKILEVEPSY